MVRHCNFPPTNAKSEETDSLRHRMLQGPLDLWIHSLYLKIFMLGHYFMLSRLMEPMLRLARESYLHYANYWYLPLLVL